MHILEYKLYYDPEIAAGIALDSNTAEDIAKRGHYVHLYVPTPCRGIPKELAKSTSKREEKIDGHLRIYRYGMFREKSPMILRVMRYICCSFKQVHFGLRDKRIELIFAGSTPPFQGLICGLIKRLRRVPFVYNCQDIFPDSMVTAGITTEGSILYKIGESISRYTYKRADRIIVISELMKKTLLKKGVSDSKISVIPNWVDEGVIYPVDYNNNKLIKALKIPNYKFTVVYAGNLGYAQSLDVVLKCAEILKKNKEIGFVIFGNGALEEKIKNSIAKRELSNVSLYQLQPYDRVSEVYSIGDACIVSCKAGTGGNAMPSKTWNIMGCGRAVLASFDKGTSLETIINESCCGLFAPADDCKKLVENIEWLYHNPCECKKMGYNARKYIEENHTRNTCTSQIVGLLEEVYREKVH